MTDELHDAGIIRKAQMKDAKQPAALCGMGKAAAGQKGAENVPAGLFLMPSYGQCDG